VVGVGKKYRHVPGAVQIPISSRKTYTFTQP